MRTKLQVALDLLDLDKAVKLARETVLAGVDIVEAGTPLIQKFGLNNVLPALRKVAEDRELVADLKITDVGYLTAKIAFESNADIVTVLCASPESTIRGVIDAAREYGGRVMADLIVSRNIKGDAEKALKLGVDYILFHVGIDEQTHGKTAVSLLAKNAANIPFEKIAVAGGINSTTLPSILRFRPGIVIVGGAITKSTNPTKTVKELIKIIDAHLQHVFPE